MQNLKNIGRIEDIIKRQDHSHIITVGNLAAFWLLCERIDSALRAGEDYTIPHYMTFARSLTFQRHKTSDVPKDAKRLTFYGQKYYIYE